MAKIAPDASASGNQRFSLYHSAGSSEAFRRWLDPYASLFVNRKQVLDVGCGPGHFLELLKEKGVEGFGIDNDIEMVDACTQAGLRAVLHDSSKGLKKLDKRFDGIHAGHVIEHMNGSDAIIFLQECCEVLEPDGIIVIRTPNWENQTVRHKGFWLDITHVRPYPLPLLERVLVDLGFEITAKGTEQFGWEDIYIVGKKTMDSFPVNPQEINKKGKKCFEDGDMDGAYNYFSKVVDAYPDHPEGLNNFGVVLWRQNRKAEGYKLFLRAVDADPSNYDALINLLDCGRDLERWQEILDVINKYIDSIPDNPLLLKRKAEAVERLDQKRKASI